MIDHYTKLLRQHHAPKMAKVKPLLDPSSTPFGPQLVEESGTLAHRVVKLGSNLPFPGSSTVEHSAVKFHMNR
jgi:hypothetical protein